MGGGSYDAPVPRVISPADSKDSVTCLCFPLRDVEDLICVGSASHGRNNNAGNWQTDIFIQVGATPLLTPLIFFGPPESPGAVTDEAGVAEDL